MKLYKNDISTENLESISKINIFSPYARLIPDLLQVNLLYIISQSVSRWVQSIWIDLGNTYPSLENPHKGDQNFPDSNCPMLSNRQEQTVTSSSWHSGRIPACPWPVCLHILGDGVASTSPNHRLTSILPLCYELYCQPLGMLSLLLPQHHSGNKGQWRIW